VIDILDWLFYCDLISCVRTVLDPLYGIQVLFAVSVCFPVGGACNMGGKVRGFSGCDWLRSTVFVESDLK
jgi:hypothetical protein